jgi:hypothetical protein
MGSEKRPPETLKALAEESFARWRERPAFTSMGVTLRYGEVERLSGAFGAFLRRELGLAPGERFAAEIAPWQGPAPQPQGERLICLKMRRAPRDSICWRTASGGTGGAQR